MNIANSKDWTINHSKAYIVLSLCIADGFLNEHEKKTIKACVDDWLSEPSPAAYAALIKLASDELSKARMGAEILDGVQKSAKHIAAKTKNDRKHMYRFLKQLKSIAEADKETQEVTDSEIRVMRFVSRGFGFGRKVSITVSENAIQLQRN